MTLGGWITFLLSTGLFTALFAWCMYKVLKSDRGKLEDIHEAFEIYDSDEDSKRGGRR